MVVQDLEEEADGGYEGCAISGGIVSYRLRRYVRVNREEWNKATYTSVSDSACISLIANLNNPPVLLPTISR